MAGERPRATQDDNTTNKTRYPTATYVDFNNPCEITETRQIKKRASSPGPGQRTPNKVTIQQLKQSFPDVDDFKARTPKLEKERKCLIDDNQVRIHSSTSIYLCNDTDHSQEDNETFTSESQEKAPDGAPNPSPNRWARGTPIRETTKNKHSVTINLEGQKFKQSPPPDQKIFQILVTIAHAKQYSYPSFMKATGLETTGLRK